MRLAYLVSQYPAITHTFILREIRTLRELGYDIRIVSIRAPDRAIDQMSPEEREENAHTWAVLPQGWATILAHQLAVLFTRPGAYLKALWSALAMARGNLRAMGSNLAYFAEAVTAGRYLEQQGCTHLHTHFASTVALLLGRVFPITWSATIHGPDEFNDALGFYLAEKAAEAAFLCTISQYARSQLMRASHPRDWHKMDVSPLGVDPQRFTPRPHRAGGDRLELVSVGRLAAAKAQILLVEAVAQVKQHGPVRLRIAGEGPERPALQQRIAQLGLQKEVILEGACSQDQVRQLYSEADLFVLASFAEGVPVVLMEAMAMEIPCISTWITGVPELIEHGVSGWLIPPADAAALAGAILHLREDASLRQRLGQAGRLRVQEKYNLRRNTERLAGIFQRRLDKIRS